MGKPAFRPEVIRKKIEALFPGVSAFSAISGGKDSQAYRFSSEDRDFVFRLNSRLEGFEKDKFVFERFAKPRLPIPEIFQIGQFEDHFYCVSEGLPGQTLEDVDSEHISRLLSPARDVWHAIAEFDISGISGYGLFDSKGTTTFSTWRGFLVGILDTSQHLWHSVRPYTNGEAVGDWGDTLYRLTAFCGEERGLVHGDFGSNNVLADGEQITGVVDWSEGLIGDPLYDVANIFFWRTWLPCMEQQARFFESHPLSLPNWKERVLCYQLRIGLSEVLANSLERRDEAAGWALKRCEQIVREIDGTL
jgi:hygromycin-B 4-O-kinase